jgi:tRNA(Ile)-lysidine synthetase-like protein
VNHLEARWLGHLLAHGQYVRDTRILVACSGGGDSMALLVFLLAVRKSLGLELTVACADHGLRPEAAQEADLVRQLCRSADLDLVEARLEVQTHAKAAGLGLETAARELRWAWLKAAAAAAGATAVATGHTLDDHTETVLLRLTRGGGTGCLTPLPFRQDLRWSPLIHARRTDLRAYLQQHGVSWMEDASNLEPFTPRNRWRQLLEPMRREAPALDQHLWETHLQVEELRSLRDEVVGTWRGARWEALTAPPQVLLAQAWTGRDLRWTLEAAFRELDWPRQAQFLRDLTAWMLPLLQRRPGKRKAWGGWQLESMGKKSTISGPEAPFLWILTKKYELGHPSGHPK